MRSHIIFSLILYFAATGLVYGFLSFRKISAVSKTEASLVWSHKQFPTGRLASVLYAVSKTEGDSRLDSLSQDPIPTVRIGEEEHSIDVALAKNKSFFDRIAFLTPVSYEFRFPGNISRGALPIVRASDLKEHLISGIEHWIKFAGRTRRLG
jgi:hypothetical protein